MKTNKLVDILKKRSFNVPLYLFQIKDKIKLDMNEFIFLIYLTNLGDKILFDINRFSTDLNISVPELLVYIDTLTEKNYISVDVIKNDKNIMEEYITLDLFYEKVTNILLDDINDNDNKEEEESIYDIIQKELARPITPMESEYVDAWLEAGNSEELVREAVAEAVLNGAPNFRYIDKVLYEWSKKGIKTKKDVEDNRKNFKKNQEKKEKLDLFEYDWFEEDEEE